MDIAHKIIVITGASDGIGKETALRLAEEDTKLAIIGRDSTRLEQVKRACEKAGASEVQSYPCDVRVLKDIQLTTDQIIKDFGQVHALINNAGIWHKMDDLQNIDEQVIDDVITTNLSGTIHFTKQLLPHLLAQKEAVVLNIVSKSGIVAQKGQSVYTASKFGVKGFTDVLKADLKGTPVKVAGVYQSGTNTQMFKKAGDNFSTDDFTEASDLADAICYMLTRPEKIWMHEVHVDR